MALPILLVGVLNIPQTQVYIAKKITNKISENIDGDISIEKFSINFALKINLKKVLIKDKEHDTLLYAEHIKVRIGNINRTAKVININKAEITGLNFCLRKHKKASTLNINYFIRQLSTKKTSQKWSINVSNAILVNSSFIFDNYNHDKKPASESGMDYNRIGIENINAKISDFYFRNDTIGFWVKKMSATEHSGLVIKDLHSRMKISSTGWKMEDLGIETPLSNIVAIINLSYSEYSDMSDWINKINMSATIKPSQLEMSDIKYFAPLLADMKNQIHITGEISGTISQLNVKNLMLYYKDNTKLYGDINMIGLPNINETFIHLKMKDCETSQKELLGFKLPNNKALILPNKFSKLGYVTINGNFTGFLDNFVSYATFNTDLGELNTDIKLYQNDSSHNTIYKGDLSANEFNIGKFISAEDKFGKMKFSVTVEGEGIESSELNIKMDGYCNSLEFMGTTIDSIDIDGKYSNSRFSGKLAVQDNDVQLDFSGLLDFNDNNKKFDFISHIKNAKLSNLNISNRADDIELSVDFRAGFSGMEPDSINGFIEINDLKYRENDVMYFLDTLLVSSKNIYNGSKIIELYSDYIDAEVKGDISIKNINKAFNNWANNYLPAIFNYKDATPQSMDFDVTLKNTDAITHLFLPSLKIAKNTKVHGLFNSSEKGLAFQGETDFIELNGIKFTELNFNAKENGDKYTFKTSAKELVLYENESTEEKEADTLKITKLGLDNLGFSASFKNDTISYLLHWDDISDADRNRANIDGYLSIIDAKNANNHFNEVSITINDSLWIASKNNNILFSDSLISFTNLAFNRGEQKIAVNGNISYLPQDKFDVVLNNFDISNFDMFFSSMNFDVDGIINADFSFRNIKKNQVPQFFGDFNIKELKFNKETLGDMKLTSQWMDSLQSFKIDGDITYHGNKGSRKLLSLNGDYCPKTSLGNDSIYLKSSVHGLTLKALNPFFDDFMSELTGRATGNLVLGGSLSKPELTGSLDIVRAGLRIDYLNTKYYFADKVSFDTDAIVFDNIMIYDSLGNTSVLNGKIKHNYFSDYYINLHITPNEFSGLNTDRSHNSLFYGSAFATGKVDITGPVSAISFNVKVKTNKGTKVIIPISTDESAMESDFITFISTNQEEEDIVSYLSLKPEGFNMNLEFDITPDAEAEIILPFAMGNINAKGNGNFRLEITSAGDFSMYGDYIIDEGDFIFKVPTIQLRREFDIRRGGKIAWSGDPYDADINIDAVYKVKSSLKGMPAIEALNPDLASERINVNCVLGLKNKLFNPDINFSIELPDSDARIRELVYSSIDTTDVSEMNKQMLYLLVLNSFSTSGVNTSVNSSLSGTSFDLLSNQVSNWLSQISGDLDVGFNYQPGDSYTSEEIEVALSTQLFDDRVSVDGNFGVTNMEQESSTSNIVGDVDVEIKITKDGRFRVKAFNKTNNVNLLEVDAPYTQGVGVFYRKEFDSFQDIFRRKKFKKKKPQ